MWWPHLGDCIACIHNLRKLTIISVLKKPYRFNRVVDSSDILIVKHCPKRHLNLRANTEPGTAGADATVLYTAYCIVYMTGWCVRYFHQLYVNRDRVGFYVEILFIFRTVGFVQHIPAELGTQPFLSFAATTTRQHNRDTGTSKIRHMHSLAWKHAHVVAAVL